jgi:probable HAF family extracellular repeat protein
VAARAINDQGQIVGDGIIDGKEQAFLLTPVQ